MTLAPRISPRCRLGSAAHVPICHRSCTSALPCWSPSTSSESPAPVFGLRHACGRSHHLGASRALLPAALGPLREMLQSLGAEESAIPSRWQHDAVPPWRRLPAELVCEVKAASLIDAGRWLRQA